MRFRAIISPVLAVALLIAQCLGAAAHCVPENGGVASAHHGAVAAAPDHGTAGRFIISADDTGTSNSHSHANVSAPAAGVGFAALAGDCMPGSMVLQPGDSGGTEPVYVRFSAVMPGSTVPSAHTQGLPTPPPNDVV